MTWYPAARVEEFTTQQCKTVFIEDVKILIVNLQDHFYAIEDVCTHDGGDLGGGEIEGDEVICPRHGARFCIKTGEVRSPPAYEDIQSFETKVTDGVVYVEV